MEKQIPDISEEEVAAKIIYQHDNLGKGFRRISKFLSFQGIRLSKDQVFRIYHRFKDPQETRLDEQIVDEELESLIQRAEIEKKRVKLARAKEEKRRQIAVLWVQEADLSLEKRTKLFRSKLALLDFAKKVMPVLHPSIWIQIVDYCRSENMQLVDVLKEALGSQADYEEVREEYRRQGEYYRLNQHLRLWFEEWLLQRTDEESEEEVQDLAKEEVHIEIVDDEEEYVIPITLDYQEYLEYLNLHA